MGVFFTDSVFPNAKVVSAGPGFPDELPTPNPGAFEKVIVVAGVDVESVVVVDVVDVDEVVVCVVVIIVVVGLRLVLFW